MILLFFLLFVRAPHPLQPQRTRAHLQTPIGTPVWGHADTQVWGPAPISPPMPVAAWRARSNPLPTAPPNDSLCLLPQSRPVPQGAHHYTSVMSFCPISAYHPAGLHLPPRAPTLPAPSPPRATDERCSNLTDSDGKANEWQTHPSVCSRPTEADEPSETIPTPPPLRGSRRGSPSTRTRRDPPCAPRNPKSATNEKNHLSREAPHAHDTSV